VAISRMAYVLVLWVELRMRGFSSYLKMAPSEVAQCRGTFQVRWNVKKPSTPSCLVHVKSLIEDVRTTNKNS